MKFKVGDHIDFMMYDKYMNNYNDVCTVLDIYGDYLVVYIHDINTVSELIPEVVKCYQLLTEVKSNMITDMAEQGKQDVKTATEAARQELDGEDFIYYTKTTEDSDWGVVLPTPRKCICSIQDLMAQGCKCGGQ